MSAHFLRTTLGIPLRPGALYGERHLICLCIFLAVMGRAAFSALGIFPSSWCCPMSGFCRKNEQPNSSALPVFVSIPHLYTSCCIWAWLSVSGKRFSPAFASLPGKDLVFDNSKIKVCHTDSGSAFSTMFSNFKP